MSQNKGNVYAIILAGGIGSRLWPLSKTQKPKQFFDLLGKGKTLIQMTYERYLGYLPAENIFIITNEQYKKLLVEQLPNVNEDRLIYEPIRKNTAVSVLYLLKKIASINSKANVIISPADQYILNEEGFYSSVDLAVEKSIENKNIVVIGVKPTYADVHTGYIQIANSKETEGRFFNIKTFTEKPGNKDLAKTFLKSGEFYWNTNIITASAQYLIQQYKEHLPDLYELFNEVKDFNSEKVKLLIPKIYMACENTSFKAGVLYKLKDIVMLKGVFGWSNLNNWNALWQTHDKDYVGNAVIGKHVLMYDSINSVVQVPNDKLVIVQGLDNYIVSDTENVLFICSKDEEENIRNMLSDIKRMKGDKFL